MQLQHASSASESIISAAIVNAADSILLQGRGTHDTRLDSYIKICFLQSGFGVSLEKFGNREKFGMPGTLNSISDVIFLAMHARRRLTFMDRLVSFMPLPTIWS
jgi:hypothetical protein